MGWGRFNSQFRETTWERNSRLRKARLAAKCTCGGNDAIGKPHANECAKSGHRPNPSRRREVAVVERPEKIKQKPGEPTCDYLGRLAIGLGEAALVAKERGDQVHALFFAGKAGEILALAKALGWKPPTPSPAGGRGE